jgi:hypothetical protein
MAHFDMENAVGMHQATHLAETLSEYQEDAVYFYAARRRTGAPSGKGREYQKKRNNGWPSTEVCGRESCRCSNRNCLK